MTKLATAAVVLALASTIASAHHEETNPPKPAEPIASIPDSNWTVSRWLKQSIYDTGDNKIGEIRDVLIDHDGKASAIVIGIGGFLGVGEKAVAVPYDSVHFKFKDEKWYPIINTTKDALGAAQAQKYDMNATKWMSVAPATEGRSNTPPK